MQTRIFLLRKMWAQCTGMVMNQQKLLYKSLLLQLNISSCVIVYFEFANNGFMRQMVDNYFTRENAFGFLLCFHHLHCHTFVYFENKTLSRKDKHVKVKARKEYISYYKTYILRASDQWTIVVSNHIILFTKDDYFQKSNIMLFRMMHVVDTIGLDFKHDQNNTNGKK